MTPELAFVLYAMPVLIVGVGYLAVLWQERQTRRFDQQHQGRAAE